MAKYRGWAELEEASYLSDLFQQIVADCRVSSEQQSSQRTFVNISQSLRDYSCRRRCYDF